jgi:hypothetical protein
MLFAGTFYVLEGNCKQDLNKKELSGYIHQGMLLPQAGQ